MQYIASNVSAVEMPVAMGFLSILAACSENPLHIIAGTHYKNKIGSILIYVISLAARIAATSNRKSLATAIATQKNHCDPENTCKTAISETT